MGPMDTAARALTERALALLPLGRDGDTEGDDGGYGSYRGGTVRCFLTVQPFSAELLPLMR